MKVERLIEIETADPQIGDKIHIDHYTATCQTVTPKGALFLLDQYIYERGDLRNALQSEEVLNIFKDIRDYMVPFDNGDLLRLPFAGELFDKLPSWCEPDDHKQWPLMQDRRNRLASRCGEYEWGWINNKRKSSATNFCAVDYNGLAYQWGASSVLGVRPVFQIANKEPTLRDFDNHNPVVSPDRAYVLKNSGIYYGYH